jgi:hypothetical protein
MSYCGDGFVDPTLGEECDSGVPCLDQTACDTATCGCGGGPPGSTTTTTLPSGLAVTIDQAACSTEACTCPGGASGLLYHLSASGTVSGPVGTRLVVNVNALQGGTLQCGTWTPIACSPIACCERPGGAPETLDWTAPDAIALPCACPSIPGWEHNYVAQAVLPPDAVEAYRTTTACP